MEKLLLEKETNLKTGTVIERINRFTLKVNIDNSIEKVYLANPGALSTVLSKDNKVLCESVDNPDRKTEYNAFAIKTEDVYVVVHSTFANKIFPRILEMGILDIFENYNLIKKEPQFPDHGRADFLLENNEERLYVEIKSCTHVEQGIAKFPDRPTKRGRRHLKSLMRLEGKNKGFVLFVIQREDATEFRPFKKIDPDFYKLLKKAQNSGVDMKAITISLEPPKIFLKNENLQIRFT